MTTQAQLAANRRNAAKSTGPKTPEGRQIVALNAVTHGLAAARVLIDDDDRPAFMALYNEVHAEVAPAGPVERALTDRIVTLTWRIRRAERMEAAVINVLAKNGSVVNRIDRARSALSPDAYDKLAVKLSGTAWSGRTIKFRKELNRLEELLCPNDPSHPQTVLGCVAIEDFHQTKVLERLLKYQTTLERSLFKTITELHTLQKQRNAHQKPEAQAPGADRTRNTKPRFDTAAGRPDRNAGFQPAHNPEPLSSPPHPAIQ